MAIPVMDLPATHLASFDLSPERLRIAQTLDRNVLVLAGPGAGKTHLLTAHAVWLAEQQRGRVVVLTFSHKAADDLSERVAQHAGTHAVRRLIIARTLHAHALDLLRVHGDRLGLPAGLAILETADVDRLFSEVASELGTPPPARPAAELARLTRTRSWPDPTDDDPTAKLFRAVVTRMRERGTVDWDTCMRLATELLEEVPEVRRSVHHHDRFILVDEAQDTDAGQLAFVEQLVGGPRGAHLFVVMDPDQSLYAFRDADPRGALDWSRRFDPLEVEIEENFRCGPRIVALARRVLDKPATPASTGGAARLYVAEDLDDEARFVHTQLRERLENGRLVAGDVAVLARAHHRLDDVRAWLSDQGIPVRTQPRLEWSAAEDRVLGALSFLAEWNEGAAASEASFAFLRNVFALSETELQRLQWEAVAAERHPGDTLNDARWLAVRSSCEQARRRPAELIETVAHELGIELGQDDKLRRLARQARSLGELLRHARTAAPRDEKRAPGGVMVTTFHGAKGLEFKTVFIVGCEEGVAPDFRARTEAALLEERRALYVAITRAADEVIMSWVRQRGTWRGVPSRFLPPPDDPIWSPLR